MAMTSLKRAPKELKASEEPAIFKPDPFPVSLHLSEEEVGKLGLGKSQVGDVMNLSASVKVTSVSMRHAEGQDKRGDVTLTLTEAEVAKPSSKSQAEKLFGAS